MQTATSETESKSLDLSICVHHYTLRAPCPKGQGKGDHRPPVGCRDHASMTSIVQRNNTHLLPSGRCHAFRSGSSVPVGTPKMASCRPPSAAALMAAATVAVVLASSAADGAVVASSRQTLSSLSPACIRRRPSSPLGQRHASSSTPFAPARHRRPAPRLSSRPRPETRMLLHPVRTRAAPSSRTRQSAVPCPCTRL